MRGGQLGGGESWLQYEHVKSNLSPPTPPRVSLGPRGPLGPMIHHSGGMRVCFGNSHYLGVFAEISRSIGYLAQIMACGAKMSPKMWATAENLTSNLKKPGEMMQYCCIILNYYRRRSAEQQCSYCCRCPTEAMASAEFTNDEAVKNNIIITSL